MNRKKVKSILLIDDDVDEFDLVTEAVDQIDQNVKVYFLDREENCKNYTGHHFDILLLDINMPQADGFAWLKKIKEKRKDLPVVMYSNSSSPAHISKAYDEGAALYFNKPENFQLLVKGISKLLDLDWDNPLAITRSHIQNGHYFTFS